MGPSSWLRPRVVQVVIEVVLVILAISQILTLLALRRVIKTSDFFLKYSGLQNQLNNKFIDAFQNTGEFINAMAKLFEGKKCEKNSEKLSN